MRGAAGRREDFRARAARQPGGRIGQLHQAAANAGAARSRQPPRHRPEPGYRRNLRDAVHAPRQSASRLHHHHRRLRQILRLLRGAVHARAGAQPHQRERAERSARAGRAWATPKFSCWARTSTAIAIRRPPAGISRTLLARRGRSADGIRRVRFTTSHPRDFVKEIVDAIDDNPVLCNHVHLPVQSGSIDVLDAHAAALHARRIYAPHRVDEEGAPRHRHHHRHHRRIPGRDRSGLRGDARAAGRSGIRFVVQLQVLAPAEHAGARAGRSDSGRGKDAAASRSCRRSSAPFRSGGIPSWSEPSKRPSWKATIRPRVNGSGEPRKTGTLNFTHPEYPGPQDGATLAGKYWNVRVTRAGPNSLAGEAVN